MTEHRTRKFLLSGAIAILVLAVVMQFVSPGWRRQTGPAVPDVRDYYLANYQGVGVDYYLAIYGLFGQGARIRSADLLMASSSKGVFGFRAPVIADATGLRAFNLSFGNGEGFGVVAEIIKTLDLREKRLLIDLNENTGSLQYSKPARAALEAGFVAGVRKVISVWLRFTYDWSAQAFLPRLEIGSDGILLSGRYKSRGTAFRSWTTNDLYRQEDAGSIACEPGHREWAFDKDGLIEKIVFAPARQRNIEIVATAIPYRGDPREPPIYDPGWAEFAARQRGIPYIPVPWQGLMSSMAATWTCRVRACFPSGSHRVMAGEYCAAMNRNRKHRGSPTYRRLALNLVERRRARAELLLVQRVERRRRPCRDARAGRPASLLDIEQPGDDLALGGVLLQEAHAPRARSCTS